MSGPWAGISVLTQRRFPQGRILGVRKGERPSWGSIARNRMRAFVSSKVSVPVRGPGESFSIGCSCSRDKYSPWTTGPWSVANDNLYVLVERCKKPHQALDREALQAIFRKSRDFGLVDA